MVKRIINSLQLMHDILPDGAKTAKSQISRCIGSIRSLIGVPPNPNYLAEMRAGVREECAVAMCDYCGGRTGENIERIPVYIQVPGLAGTRWVHKAHEHYKPEWERCNARFIRSLDLNHSNVVEGMKREAVKPYLNAVLRLVNQFVYIDQEWPKVSVGVGLGVFHVKPVDDEMRDAIMAARALLKEGE